MFVCKNFLFICGDDLQGEESPALRRCYEGVQRDGEVIRVRDTVLLRSGPRKKSLPYVAKVSAFWEDPESGTPRFITSSFTNCSSITLLLSHLIFCVYLDTEAACSNIFCLISALFRPGITKHNKKKSQFVSGWFYKPTHLHQKSSH